MILRFLGTGTSMGIPVIGCSCPVCTSDDPRNRRTRTAALICDGDRRLLIDAGPDFRAQALAAQLSRVDAVLVTHSHFDHIAGIDDLRPLASRESPIPIFGAPHTIADIRERFHYAFAETSVGSTRPSIELHAASEPFTAAGLRVEPLEIMHGTWPITAYRIGGLGYVTDASVIPPAARDRLRGLDVLVLNALRYEPHPTHLSVEEALAVVADLQPRQAFFVHMTHNVDHVAGSAELPPGVAFAHDGLEVAVTP